MVPVVVIINSIQTHRRDPSGEIRRLSHSVKSQQRYEHRSCSVENEHSEESQERQGLFRQLDLIILQIWGNAALWVTVGSTGANVHTTQIPTTRLLRSSLCNDWVESFVYTDCMYTASFLYFLSQLVFGNETLFLADMYSFSSHINLQVNLCAEQRSISSESLNSTHM